MAPFHSDPSCLFCQIIAGKIPANKIYEDNEYLAFLDIQPIARGHALIVPKNHSPDLLRAPPKDRKGLLEIAAKIAPAILAATGAGGFNIGINTGADSGQIVFHTHAHIIPRAPKDGLTSWANTKTPFLDLHALAVKITQNL